MNETPLNAIEPEGPSAPPRLRFTLVSTALILGAYLVLQVAATVAAAMLGLDPAARMGDLVALGVIFSAVPCTFLVLLVLGLARGVDPKSWLALVPVRTATLLGWLVFAVLLLLLADLATVELGRSPVPPVMETIIETTQYTTLLWVALVIAAPVFEEALFRGFMFEGLRRTRIGAWGTIAVTTLLWTLLHVGQYDQYFLVLIALIGILLGFARERTGSLYVPSPSMRSTTCLASCNCRRNGTRSSTACSDAVRCGIEGRSVPGAAWSQTPRAFLFSGVNLVIVRLNL